MSNANLNLARKWRSQAFDQIIGQDLPIRILKNSLYLESFFPVYLFSGTRGCGKTTMARVFSSAINCEQLSEFRKSPKLCSVPCLKCASCIAMLSGKHPDFIEIDAASHTGVDNVRQIIDAASFMPVMGRKKIYLIDEAHMLSKAAFNALLKILEEPPASVLFILATTESQKIIDTIKSRCFQLFFSPVDAPRLFDHLSAICTEERINFEASGLQLVIKSTEGSVRDAINLLEQVRYSTSCVTKEAVLDVLGHIDEERLLTLFDLVLTKSSGSVLQYMQAQKFSLYSADFIWSQLLELARAALYVKHDLEPQYFTEHVSQLRRIIRTCSMAHINALLDIFYTNETIFLRTTAQHAFLEMILLKFAQSNGQDDNSGTSSVPQSTAVTEYNDDEPVHDEDEDDQESDDEEDEEDDEEEEGAAFQKSWNLFISKINSLNDPLLNSVFKQGTFIQCDMNTKTLDIAFSKDLSFFKDWLDETSKLWGPLLTDAFGASLIFNPAFTGDSTKKIVAVPQPLAMAPKPQAFQPKNSEIKPHGDTKPMFKPKTASMPQEQYKKTFTRPYTSQYPKKYGARAESNHPIIDVSDKSLWKKANMLLQHFPGVIREIRENIHEQKA